MTPSRKISLLLADVDGTLLTDQKVLTERAKAAVRSLHRADIRFAITSGRPPRGMSMLFDPLNLDTPIAGFNGGLFVQPDLSILERKTIPPDVAREAVELIRGHDLDVWVYRDNDWLITKPDAPHVERETSTVEFRPKVVHDLDEHLDEAIKIVGISDDSDKMQRCESDAQDAFGERATAARSQPYYLDITHEDANKGAALRYLARTLGIAASEVATIGDQPNDVLMFDLSGFSIAMGNASDEVKKQADATTDSYNNEGFAKAIERFILNESD
jgi:Cof subfamily protein (haloacid dehalogenase superfamily)